MSNRLSWSCCISLLNVFTAYAQLPAADSSQVYSQVEYMPELPSGGGILAVKNEVARHTLIPCTDSPVPIPFLRTIVSFVVGPSGTVYGEKLLMKSGFSGYDSAVLRAVRGLPRLRPGQHVGRPVAVQVDMAITVYSP